MTKYIVLALALLASPAGAETAKAPRSPNPVPARLKAAAAAPGGPASRPSPHPAPSPAPRLAPRLAPGPAAAEALPVPPIPPLRIPAGGDAPMPDLEATGPQPEAGDAASVSFKLYRATVFNTNLGFAPGSRFQDHEERKPFQTPGLAVSVPFK
jgi:hypothetical protein